MPSASQRPRGPSRVVGTARAAARAAAFGMWTAGSVFGQRVLAHFVPRYDEWHDKQRLVHGWSSVVLPIFGLDVDVRGEARRDEGPFLVVANHRSPLDILLAVHFVGGVILSNHAVADMPVIGNAARANETIFVNRGDRKSGAQAIRSMRRRLTEGRNVIVFPEGDTFRGDEVRPFKRGAFTAARGLTDVQVLPLGLAYEPGAEYVDEEFSEHLFRMSANRRTRVWLRIGEPCPLPGRDGEETIRAVVQELVDDAVRAREAT